MLQKKRRKIMPLNCSVLSENSYQEQTKTSKWWHVKVPFVQFITCIYLHKCIHHLSYCTQQSYITLMPAGEKEQQETAWRKGAGLQNEESKGETDSISTLIQGEWSNTNYFFQWCLPDTAEGALFDFALCFEIVHLLRPTHKYGKQLFLWSVLQIVKYYLL